MNDQPSKRVGSGEKFRNAQGIAAIKDGQKRRATDDPVAQTEYRMRGIPLSQYG